MPAKPELQKQVFVAYAYNIYDRRDYRRAYTSLEGTYGIKFLFADEKITNMHILQKISSYIKASDFSLFDISGWNPNVTLELGIAIEHSDNWYICFNPDRTPLDEVPSDIKGIDRIQYKSFTELGEKLTALLEQRYPKQTRLPLEEYIKNLTTEALSLMKKSPGLRMEELSDILKINVRMAQVVLEPLIGKRIRIEGKTRGARYFLL